MIISGRIYLDIRHMNEEASKRVFLSNPVVAVIVFFVLLFVFAKWGPAINFSTTSQSKGEPMTVTGEGKTAAVPDIARISAGIQDSGTNLAQVQSSVNKRSQSLVAALKKLGVDEKDIETISYGVNPHSDYQTNPPQITGYEVSINYQVTVRDLGKINDVLVNVTGAGANLVGGVSFDLSDDAEAKAYDSARKDAASKAKQKAESLAKAAGITLGRIINISESQGGQPRPFLFADKAVTNAAEITPPDVQPGTTEINVSVSISYEIR